MYETLHRSYNVCQCMWILSGWCNIQSQVIFPNLSSLGAEADEYTLRNDMLVLTDQHVDLCNPFDTDRP